MSVQIIQVVQVAEEKKRTVPYGKFLTSKLPPRGEVSFTTSPIWRYCACQERTVEHQISSLDMSRKATIYRCVQCGKLSNG